MVRLKGPCLAQTAAGGLGKALIFAENKGRAYAKRWAQPRNPDSATQHALRAMIQYLTQRWAAISPADQATWLNTPDAPKLQPYYVYLAYNLKRWRDFKAPSEVYPATDLGTLNVFTTWTATATSRAVIHTLNVTVLGDGRCFLLFRSQTFNFTPSWSTLRHVIPTLALGQVTWKDTPLVNGTYYHRIARTTRFGNKFLSTVARAATVT